MAVLVSWCANTTHIHGLKTRRVLLNLVWEQSSASLLFSRRVAFIFRWSVAALAQHMLICEDNESTYTHTKLRAGVQMEAATLGEGQQCRSCLSAAERDMLQRLSEDFML